LTASRSFISETSRQDKSCRFKTYTCYDFKSFRVNVWTKFETKKEKNVVTLLDEKLVIVTTFLHEAGNKWRHNSS